ncbi:D-alanyl-D-alanine carboxypeptidase family protein [Ruminococcus sp.]|uniref:M15 family metallopeptidase n=1 Tax=Ruminococcus sp. TaxID=41978 RepID=UPI0025F9EB5B|nr:M15 family metallopeptidase [Ruminococcus sp.]
MDYLMLVDKFNPVDSKLANTLELTEVQGKLVEAQAGRQLRMLLKEAAEAGINLRIISAYRSFEYQQMLWEREVSHEMWGGLDYENAVAKVARTLALPGSSEHNTGLAVDIGRAEDTDVSDDFYRTAESRWLCANAAKYGFILRYPRMKEHITGIDFEPWHYRYVGTEAAELITKSGVCLEEFLHFYSEKYI